MDQRVNCVTQGATEQLPQQDDSSVFVLFILLNLVLIYGGGCKGRGQIQGDWEISGIRTHDMKSTKSQ